jgi:DNA-binding MarR family transcriptional regulator
MVDVFVMFSTTTMWAIYFQMEGLLERGYRLVMASPSAVSTWERLVRFQRIATTAMDDNLRSTCGHSLDDCDALHQMNRHGKPIRMGDLAEQLLVANSSCHRIVGRLVDAGFVARIRSEHDRRSVLVELTAEGRRLRRRMAAVHTRDIERTVGTRFSASELADLDAAFDRLLSPAPAASAAALPKDPAGQPAQ